MILEIAVGVLLAASIIFVFASFFLKAVNEGARIDVAFYISGLSVMLSAIALVLF